MARLADREKAITLRLQQMSYSQIKEKLGINKSTLHYWLKDYPLSEKRIRELRDNSEKRIERFRQTMQHKRDVRLESVYRSEKKQIRSLSPREFFLTGLALYWAEGVKASNATLGFANTDPSMVRFFLKWAYAIGAEKESIRVRLHLYSDMDIRKQTVFWSHTLDVPLTQFRKPYIKESLSEKRRNYKGRFGQGTCTVFIYKQTLHEKALMGIRVLRELIEGH